MGSSLQGWQPREDRIIADHYPDGGTAACLSFMPDRTYHAIRRRAHLLGVRKAISRTWVRPHHERVIDAAFMSWAEPVERTALRWAA